MTKFTWLIMTPLLGLTTAVPAYAGTASLNLQIKTTVEAGTCTAEIYDGATPTNTIALGNVPISQVINSTGNAGKSFKVRFSNCSGLPQGLATLKISRRASGCAGGNSNLPSFANSTTPTSGGAAATSLEIWQGATAGVGTQFNCYTPDSTAQDINVASAKGANVVDYELSARLVKPAGKADSEVKAGTFLGETTFTLSYK